MSNIPSELTDAIIDYLHADGYPLTACSTVSKAWLPRTRHHVFGSLRLEPATSARFFELIDCPLSTISPYIQHLHVTRAYGGGGQTWFKDLLPRLVIFTTLQSAALTLANFVFLETGLRPILESCFRLLRHLALHRCRFSSFAQFVDVMCACPHLESFTSTDLTWNADDAFSKLLRPSRLPYLRTLKLELHGIGAMLNWLRLGDIVPRVSELIITLIALDDAEYIAAFVRTLGPSLVHLEIDARSDNIIAKRLSREVNISYSTQLRGLHFKSIKLVDGHNTKWFLKFISQVISPHIIDLIFHIEVHRFKDLELLDWDALGSTLETAPFSSLRRVQFITNGEVGPRTVEGFIRRSLRHCDRRGTLFINRLSEMTPNCRP